MISTNPTKTRGIEKAWIVEINKRFSSFSQSITTELRDISKQVVVNRLTPDQSQLRVYIAFVQQQIDNLIIGDWQEKYQQRSYERAIDRAMAELKRQGVSTTITDFDRLSAMTIESFTAQSSLGLSAAQATNIPIHHDTLEFIFNRSLESLEGITATMSRDITGIVFSSIEQGLGIVEITKQINNRVNVGRSRAKLIARTETIQAYQRGTINQTALASEFLDEEVKLRWNTVRDNKVRHLHAKWHGKVFTEKQARKNISISPFNCRCGLSPVIKEADTPEKTSKFTKERKQLQALTQPTT